jgi:glycosyltransferase involved in cell wall biosynthesis
MGQGARQAMACAVPHIGIKMSTASRILLCCENYPPSVGGVQEVMRQIAERLAAKGHSVTVATSPHPQRPVETIRNGVRVVSFAVTGNRVNGLSGPVAQYQAFLQQGFDAILIKAAQQWTFDAAIDVLPSITARKLFIPCGFSGLNNPKYVRYFQDMPQWLNLFDGLIFYASDYQDIRFARQHGLTRLHCLPNGVDEREFADPDPHDIRKVLGINEDHDLLLSVGSLIAAKGHWEVLRAFGQARLSRPTTLVINGNVPGKGMRTEMKRALKHGLTGRLPLTWEAYCINARFKNANLSKRVIITDLSRADLVNLYKAADLFVFASHVEYSPLVLFEAAAAGTPFLASSAGNSQEIVNWTGGGMVIQLQNPRCEVFTAELAKEIEDLMSNPSVCSRLGAKGRSSIYGKGFTWESIAEIYCNLLQKNPQISPTTPFATKTTL